MSVGNNASASMAQLNAAGVPYEHSMVDSRTRGAFPGLDYRTVSDPAELMRVATREGRDQRNPSVDACEKLRAVGGKMIYWHGVNDPNAPVAVGMENIRERFPDADGFIRTYPVPGVGHCAGGNGPTEVDQPLLNSLVAWVEQGKPPESVTATRTTPARGVEREFLLCPDPRRAHLKAPGLDYTRAENWECRAAG